jgi:hypothetical protein
MTLPKKPDNPDEHDAAGKAGRGQPVWMVVATASGIAEAAIIAGRLESLGIPAYIDRESLGAVLGLTVGIGQARVVVPQQFYEAALAVLEPDPDIPWLGDGDDMDEDDGEDVEDDNPFDRKDRRKP